MSKKKLRNLIRKIDPSSKAEMDIADLRDRVEEKFATIPDYSNPVNDIRVALAKLSDEIETKFKELPDPESFQKEFEAKYVPLLEEIEQDINDLVGKSAADYGYLNDTFEEFRMDVLSRLANLGGGSMNRQILINGVDVLKKYTDINYIAGDNVTLSTSDDNTNKRTNITITAADGGASPAGDPTELQYNFDDVSFGALTGSAVDPTSRRLGLQETVPDAPLHVNNTVVETLANPASLTVTRVLEVALTTPSASAVIEYVANAPTNPSTAETNVGSGFFTAQMQTINYQIYAATLVDGIYYFLNNTPTSYTDSSGDFHTFDVQISWDSMPNADTYFVYNSTNSYYYDTSGSTSVTDNGTGTSGTPPGVNVSGGFTASGQTINYYPVMPGTSPSGQLYYSANGATYSVTDLLNNGSPFIIVHTSANTPLVLKDTTNTTAIQMNASPLVQTTVWGSDIDTSTKHYGFLSNGTNLNRTYRVNTFNSRYGIYSSGIENSVTDPNDGLYYSVSGSFPIVTQGPQINSYKKFRKATGGSYGNSIFDSSLTFVDDALSQQYGQSSTVTPTSILPNTLVAEGESDSTSDAAIGVFRSTALSNAIAQIAGENAVGTVLWALRNDASSNVYLGSSSSTSVYLGRLANPNARFGSVNEVNITKDSVVHFIVWGTNATLPNIYSFSAHNTVYFGANPSSDPNTMVMIVPKNSTQKGLVLRQVTSSAAVALQEWQALNSAVFSQVDNEGRFGIGTTAGPNQWLQIAVGTTAMVPIKLTSGSLKTAPIAGGIEFLTDKIYFTITTGTARKEFTLNDIALTSGRIPFVTTNGRITDDDDFTFTTTTGFVVNETGTSTIDVRFEGDTDANLFFSDASTDRIGIGASAPATKFHIISTTEQLRVGYDTSNYLSITINSTGSATLNLTGTNPEFTFSDPVNVPDEAYGSGWDGNTEVPTKNAIYDKIESLNAVSGTYTPTLTGVANVGASTAYVCQYMRVGNVITVSGQVDIDPTLGVSTTTQLGISLPVASNFASATECAGTCCSPSIASQSGGIYADATNDRAQLEFKAADPNNTAWYFHFTYQVI